MNRHCRPQGVKVQFHETKLPASRVEESNVMLLNRVALEQVLGNAKAGRNRCGSCSELLETETQCRSVSHGGETLEAIPSQLMLRAACSALD
jgi:hypothetical protein